MRILFTNFILQGASGTEMYLRDLARRFRRAGHQVMVTSPHPGPLAEALASEGIEFSADPAGFSTAPDIIHGHHNLPLIAALSAWPGTPGLFVCHDAAAWHDEAPRFPRILKYGAVDALRAKRVAADVGCAASEVFIRGNTVDLERFRPRPPLPQVPARAAVFSHYAASHNYLPVVQEACRAAGLTLDVLGEANGTSVAQPENVLGNYDLVFAIGRCAMEALATGCGVVLCGMGGCGPLVTAGAFDGLRDNNFGRACLDRPHAAEHLLAEIKKWDAAGCEDTARLARERLDLDASIPAWLSLYQEIIGQHRAGDHGEDQRAAAAFLTKLGTPLLRLYGLENDRTFLTREVQELRNRLAHAEEKLNHAAIREIRLKSQREEMWTLEGASASRPVAALLRRLGAKPAAEPPKHAPVPFIVGVPRSGTTLLRLMLNAHPDMTIPGETGFVHALMAADRDGQTPRTAREFLSIITAYPPDSPNWPECGIDESAALAKLESIRTFTAGKGLRMIGRLCAKREGKTRWGDKTPDYTECIRPIWELLPEARFIHLIRDVRDAVERWRSMPFAPSKDVRVLAQEWRRRIESVRTAAHLAPHVLEIRFEDLIRRPRETLERVCRFIRLPFHRRMLDHQARSAARTTNASPRAEQLRKLRASAFRPPDENKIGAWRSVLTEAEIGAIAEEVGELLEEFSSDRK